MSARTGRAMTAADKKMADLIRDLNTDRTALRKLVREIEQSVGEPIYFDGSRKLIDFDWLVRRLNEVLP